MSNQKAITLDYKPVTRAGAGQGKQGKTGAGKAAGGGGASAAQLSYISGETLRDEKTKRWYSNPREDVLEVQVNFRTDDSRSIREKLQDLVGEIETQDGRDNSRHGMRTIGALPVDRRENLNPKLAAEHGIDVETIRTYMHAARHRICEAYDAEVRRITRGATAWAVHASPPNGSRDDMIHLHHFGTRRQVEVDPAGQVKGLSHRDVSEYASPGRLMPHILHMRQFLAQEINRELEKIESLDRWDARSYAQQMMDENAEREAAGLLPKKALTPMRHEGPKVRHFRRKFRGDFDNPAIPPEVRRIIRENDDIRQENRRTIRANYELTQRWDAVMRQTYNPILTLLEEAARMERERLDRGKKNPAALVRTPAERQRYEALIKEADQRTRKTGSNVYALKRELENLPDLVKDHLVRRYPLAGGAAVVRAISTPSQHGISRGQERGRDDRWAMFVTPIK